MRANIIVKADWYKHRDAALYGLIHVNLFHTFVVYYIIIFHYHHICIYDLPTLQDTQKQKS